MSYGRHTSYNGMNYGPAGCWCMQQCVPCIPCSPCQPCPAGPTGAAGATGVTGATGNTGATGAPAENSRLYFANVGPTGALPVNPTPDEYTEYGIIPAASVGEGQAAVFGISGLLQYEPVEWLPAGTDYYIDLWAFAKTDDVLSVTAPLYTRYLWRNPTEAQIGPIVSVFWQLAVPQTQGIHRYSVGLFIVRSDDGVPALNASILGLAYTVEILDMG